MEDRVAHYLSSLVFSHVTDDGAALAFSLFGLSSYCANGKSTVLFE